MCLIHFMSYKILVIHDDAVSPGGANFYRQELTALLRSQGHDVHLFTFRADPDDDPQRTHCYRYTSGIKFIRHIGKSYFNPPLFFFLRKVIRKLGPHFIHIHHNYLFTNTVLLACLGKIPVIQTHHDHRIVCPRDIGINASGQECRQTVGLGCLQGHCFSLKGFLAQVVPKYLATVLMKKTVTAALAPSSDLQEKIEARGIKSILLRNYTELAGHPAPPLNTGSNRLLFVGRLYEGKGVHVLLQSFKKIVQELPAAKLDIVGADESGKRQYFNMAQGLGIGGQVEFHGQVGHEKIATFYRQAFLVVLPAVWIENNPIVLLEAMAAGRPIVASRIGGIPEIVKDAENGLLCNPGEVVDLYKKIVKLLDNRAMAKIMGEKGRKIAVQNFTPAKHFTDYMQIVRGLEKTS